MSSMTYIALQTLEEVVSVYCYIGYKVGLPLMLKLAWHPGFLSISCIFLSDLGYIGVYLVSVLEVTCTMWGIRHMLNTH